MSLQFIPASSPEPVINYLKTLITERLQHGSVLWEISGGSAIPIAAAVASQLPPQADGKVTVTLVDERYGPVGHADSNWRQLLDAGFTLPGANLLPVLNGKEQAETARQWGIELEKALTGSDYRVGLLGIGPDGHTSGILPNSSAVTATGTVYSYSGPDYQRITTTKDAILKLDEVVVYASGKTKWPALDGLEQTLSEADQPAQILKSVPKVTIFTDRP